MSLIFNGSLQTTPPLFSHRERAFQYGDGLFETLRWEQGQLWYVGDHLKRLRQGMKALGLDFPKAMLPDQLSRWVADLVAHDFPDHQGNLRVKLLVWRAEGGLYTPTQQQSHFLVEVQLAHHQPDTPLKVGISFRSRVNFSPLSRFKTCSALPYVLAGLEKTERGLDDLILLGENWQVAECIASNLFWVKGDTVFTPSLKVGCIAGIARKNLINQLSHQGWQVRKIKSKPKEIIKADCVFSINVMGIRDIGQIEGTIMNTQLRKNLGIELVTSPKNNLTN